MPKSERTVEQIRVELGAERAALAAAVAELRDELRRVATLATSSSLAVGGLTFAARRLIGRRHRD